MQQKNTYGLVVCGGQSSRMGSDKGLLVYHGEPQRYYLYKMLQPYCEQVLISCNAQQATEIPGIYSAVTDLEHYSGAGPMSALLTAFKTYPGKDILLIGCDYPFFSEQELQAFIAIDKSMHSAAALYNDITQLYEPLLAWYAAGSADIVKDMFTAGQYSLQHFLKKHHALACPPVDIRSIQSADTPEAFRAAQKELEQFK